MPNLQLRRSIGRIQQSLDASLLIPVGVRIYQLGLDSTMALNNHLMYGPWCLY
jgi:hypothetical protein